MIRSRLLSFFLLCALQGFAQDRVVTVREPNGDAVPFIYAFCERTGRYAMSDNQGRMMLRVCEFADADTLLFHSAFYEPLSIEAGKLLTEVVVQPKTLSISAVGIYPEKTVTALVKRMAANFSRQMAKDYAAKVIWLSTVECNGRYREFMGYDGVFASCDFTLSAVRFDWEDRNRRCWFPLTVMKSDPLAAASDEPLEIKGVYSGNIADVSSLKIRYLNAENDPWRWKRSLEMYAPLNPKQVRNFTYRIDSVYTTGEGEVWVIHFKNKPGTFPRKTRIVGQGVIHCLCEQARPLKIVTENLEDHFILFPRTVVAAYPSATRHRVEVDYEIADGAIYTSAITAQVAWVDPGIETGRYYSYGQNRRRNPAKNRLREYVSVTFTDPVRLDETRKNLVVSRAVPQCEYNFILTAPFERQRWERIDMPGIDRQRMFRDLNVNGRTLYEQAEARAFAIPQFKPDPKIADDEEKSRKQEEKYREKRMLYYKIGREIVYPALYGEKYE